MNPVQGMLLLESSTEVCSVAISILDQVTSLKETSEGNKHSEWMTTFIQEALSDSRLDWSDLQAICVSKGPGSYTGLRVAYSVAKGIAYSLNIPIIEVDTLKSLALDYIHKNDVSKETIIIPMIDARRMEVYQAVFDSQGKELESVNAHVLTSQSFDTLIMHYDQIIIVGNGARKVHQLELSIDIEEKLRIYSTHCSAACLIHEAFDLLKDKRFSDVAYCTPMYFKNPNITKSKKPILG